MSSDSSKKIADSTRAAQGERRPYQAPLLRVYGSLAKITDTVGFMGNLDGGMVILMRRTR